MTRREFAASAASVLAVAPAAKPSLCIFSKHMAQFDWDGLGKTAKQMGFDGVDLTARPKGHVLPERVAEDLPKAVEAIRAHGLSVPMITTDLTSAMQPAARPTLATAGKLRIPCYKVGYWRYRAGVPILETLATCKDLATGLIALGKECGIVTGIHNHSGDYVGSAVWDIREILSGAGPRWAGYYFDAGHAFVEGGLHGWQISLELALTRLKMAAIKDFFWEKKDGKWRVRWCPLGQGMVNWPAVFAAFAKSGYSGPLSLHVEYETHDELAAIASDLAFMKKQVAQAYGA